MSVRVRWLGHATAVLDVAGVRLVTDPLLRRHAGVLRRRGGRAPLASDWRGADVALVSHLHHDHAEVGSLRMLGDVPVLAAPSSAHWLTARGLRGVGVAPDEWRAVAGRAGGEVRVRTVPAEHGHRPMPHRPNAATGFVVRGGGLTVWFAGDTGPFPGLAHVPDLAGAPVDVALVPVGGWGPRLSGGHLDPVEAARVCALVGARVAVPVHWGTLHAPASRRLPPGWMDRAGRAFEAAVHRLAPDVEACVLEPGRAATVTPGGRTARV
ncbi:conserved hypothetical protein [Cellulomonas flavigena DSM 20109]|uniref:Metallo-beta-lactamase domain-containing protein n=1 Tax=Cellulomonas flavigena (strain ATCC 482 / DSM 20109 / BCRC 11376 / JCM 18109 / NBRC 3775 / NCIMB 8073 / NRS 134) TaxID=446466 RepID=D5UDA5_CELFN|nr:MBL fold metallo-hydrolase [Cellulomonas flavigena]ADG74442.1 conserved hypothetical protein [Cellulomonas flavigena DSM 20109]